MKKKTKLKDGWEKKAGTRGRGPVPRVREEPQHDEEGAGAEDR